MDWELDTDTPGVQIFAWCLLVAVLGCIGGRLACACCCPHHACCDGRATVAHGLTHPSGVQSALNVADGFDPEASDGDTLLGRGGDDPPTDGLDIHEDGLCCV